MSEERIKELEKKVGELEAELSRVKEVCKVSFSEPEEIEAASPVEMGEETQEVMESIPDEEKPWLQPPEGEQAESEPAEAETGKKETPEGHKGE